MQPQSEQAGPLLLQLGPQSHRDLCWHLLRGACFLLLGALLGTVLYGYSHRQVEDEAGRGVRGSEDAVAPWTALGHRADRTHAPAAHLVGHPGPSGERLRWRSDVDASFTRGGFRLANDSLVVPASGMYFVYFQASFLGAACPAGDEPLVLAHRVLLFSDTYPRDVPILSAHKTACSGGGSWYRSLHQGAAFALQEGDRLSTQTEGEAHLLSDQGTLSFGAFAL
ncbi:lymphotoxin-alpha-like [Emys orbicularis]|uniref:lymphotoxin-alpha-like n=1 Tax=Emys orbicularis TaxID=82168 RepID=UPI0031FD03F6